MRVLVIANPKAGQGLRIPAFLRRLMRVPVREEFSLKDARVRIENFFHSVSMPMEWAETQYAGHGRELAKDAVSRGVNVVIAVGGDGTVNEIINGLAGSQTALGIIPAGTANVLSGELGLPGDIGRACNIIAEGNTRTIDLPYVNERYFSMMAGIGFDAHVVRLVDRRLKGRWGVFSYLIVTLCELPFYKFESIEVITDAGERLRGCYMFVQNAQSYGSGFSASPGSKFDDGLMELIVFPGRSLITVIQYLLSASKDRFNVEKRGVRSLQISTSHDIQIDGDFFGKGPANFGIKPAALNVLVPRKR